MLRTLIKLALVALLINASWQLFSVYWSHFKFVDAVQSLTQFRGDKSDDQIRNRILELAGEFDVPVSDENLTLQGTRIHTVVAWPSAAAERRTTSSGTSVAARSAD